jgi:hypothetical protein
MTRPLRRSLPSCPSVNPVPDPSGWFQVRVVVASPTVTVFVNGGKEQAWSAFGPATTAETMPV